MLFRCFDLETTSTDTASCEVVQAAVVEAPASGNGIDLAASSARSMLFHAANIPAGAQAVHGITPEMVADAKPFSNAVRSFVSLLTADGVVAVSFNGCAYDIPIVARYAVGLPSLDLRQFWPDEFDSEYLGARKSIPATESLLRARHIDVLRLWWRVRRYPVRAPWYDDAFAYCMPQLTADMFAGSLTAAHGFFIGEGFADAHDATVDCKATLRVLDAMLREGFVPDVETAIAWSNAPLPGDVDFSGKFRWDGDRCVFAFGKFKGQPIESADTGFLRWMLGQDFPADTKELVRRFMAGEYPQRPTEVEP